MGNAGARLGIQIGFAVIGGLMGDATGFAIGGMIGGIVGSLLFPFEQPNQTAEGPKLGDLSIQTSTYGNAIPRIYGTVRVAGNVIWSTGLVEHVNITTQEVQGGKGGSSPTSTLTTYTYTVSFAVALCYNEIVGIRRIWTDDKLWYDFSNPPVGVSFQYELFTGTEDQLPCSAIEADKGAGNVPGFRGMAYIVFKDLDLTPFGNRVPNFHFEVVAAGSQELNATFLQDSLGVNGWFHQICFDEETGYVWYTRGQTNSIHIITPDLDVVHSIVGKIGAPYQISYQPPYMYIKMPPFGPAGIGQEPELREMPPHMFVSCDVWGLINIGGASAAGIGARTYEVILNPKIRGPLDSPFQPWLGHVQVDRRTIQEEDIHMEQGQFVHFLGHNINANVYSWSIGEEGFFGHYRAVGSFESFAFTSSQEFSDAGTDFGFPGYFYSDFDGRDRNQAYLYCINGSGVIYAVDEYFIPKFAVRVAIDFANLFARCCWDKFERCVYGYASDWPSLGVWLVKYDEFLGTEHWRISGHFDVVDNVNPATIIDFDIHPTTGALYCLAQVFGSDWYIAEIDKSNGAVLSIYRVANSTASPGNSRIWMDFKLYPNSMFGFATFNGGGGGGAGNGIARIPLTPAPAGSPPTLKFVVEDIAQQTGLTLADLNANDLAADTVSGYAIANRMAARTAIEPLMRGYFFDAVESDYVAKFVKRGGASVKTIPSTDLAAHEPGGAAPAQLERSRIEENEMPYQVDVNYLDPVSFYKINVQYARRLIGQSRQTVPVNIPVVFTSTQARRIADVLLYNSWIERQTATANTTRKHLNLEPSDVITVITSPNLPLLDDFERPNESPSSKWLPIPVSGEGAIGLNVVGGTLRGVAGAFRAMMHPEIFYPDIDIEVTVGHMSQDTNSGYGLACRFSQQTPTTWDATALESEHVELEFDNYDDAGTIRGYVVIWQMYNGGWSQVFNASAVTRFKYGDRVRMSARGNRIMAYINDVCVGVSNPTQVLTGNYIGLVGWESDTEIREVRVGPAAVTTTQDYRITRAEFTAPNRYDLTLTEEDTSAYQQYSIGVDNEVPSQTIPAIVPTILHFLDTSIMGRQQDDDSGFYVSVSPSFGDSWAGAGVYRSDDAGLSYAAQTSHDAGATAGVANSTLGYEGSIP